MGGARHSTTHGGMQASCDAHTGHELSDAKRLQPCCPLSASDCTHDLVPCCQTPLQGHHRYPLITMLHATCSTQCTHLHPKGIAMVCVSSGGRCQVCARTRSLSR